MAVIDQAVPTERGAQWMAAWPEAERAIHRSVRDRLPPGVDPDDISQQVFIELMKAGSRAPSPERLKFWCVAVARNVVADLYRRKALRVEDLAPAPVADTETVALTRLRCEAAAEAYASLGPADRQALAASDGGPASNKTKLRRSRARRRLRTTAERLVGGGLLVPRWGWVAGTTGAAAVIVPLCLGLGSPSLDTGPDTAHGSAAGDVVSRAPTEPAAATPGVARASMADPTVARPTPEPALPPEPTYHRRVSVSVPGAGTAEYDHYTPPPGAHGPPVACANNLKIRDSVCVEHPAK